MRAALLVVVAALLINGTLAQDSGGSKLIEVRTLTLQDGNLADGDRRAAVQRVQGVTAAAEEIQERVRRALCDEGYYFARAGEPQISAIRDGVHGRSADVTVRVEAGAVYTLGAIRVKGASVFPVEQLQGAFAVEPGGRFNATAIAAGLDRLRHLYEVKGYADFIALPKPEIDETQHVVAVVIEVQEGMRIRFGGLSLEGVEPVGGAGRALLASWSTMQGRLYNPEVLQAWLAAEATGWPRGALERVHFEYHQSSPPDGALGVLLHFQ